MPHIIVRKAQQVLSDLDSYPEVIVTDAHSIVAWSNRKREAIQAMWTKRSILRQWNDFYRQSQKHSVSERRREATTHLNATTSKTDMTIFHVGHGYLRSTQIKNALLFGMFDARLSLVAFEDLQLVHRYLACVNAQRLDDSLGAVSFLRWCGTGATAEILVWRMLRRAF